MKTKKEDHIIFPRLIVFVIPIIFIIIGGIFIALIIGNPSIFKKIVLELFGLEWENIKIEIKIIFILLSYISVLSGIFTITYPLLNLYCIKQIKKSNFFQDIIEVKRKLTNFLYNIERLKNDLTQSRTVEYFYHISRKGNFKAIREVAEYFWKSQRYGNIPETSNLDYTLKFSIFLPENHIKSNNDFFNEYNITNSSMKKWAWMQVNIKTSYEVDANNPRFKDMRNWQIIDNILLDPAIMTFESLRKHLIKWNILKFDPYYPMPEIFLYRQRENYENFISKNIKKNNCYSYRNIKFLTDNLTDNKNKLSKLFLTVEYQDNSDIPCSLNIPFIPLINVESEEINKFNDKAKESLIRRSNDKIKWNEIQNTIEESSLINVFIHCRPDDEEAILKFERSNRRKWRLSYDWNFLLPQFANIKYCKKSQPNSPESFLLMQERYIHPIGKLSTFTSIKFEAGDNIEFCEDLPPHLFSYLPFEIKPRLGIEGNRLIWSIDHKGKPNYLFPSDVALVGWRSKEMYELYIENTN